MPTTDMPATRTPHDPPAASVLFVDDIPELCQHMVATLSGAGIEATAIGRPSEALPQIIAGKYQVVITTLVMVEMCGFDIIRKIRGAGCDVPIIMITGYGTEQSAIEAARLGVADYMTKPIADAEVIARVRRVLAGVTPPGQTRPRKLAKMISVDPRMLEIFDWVKTIAPTDSRALILGQTGCGKQLLAHAIHQQSRRAKEPFVEVNCAAIPANLLESELFGHEAVLSPGRPRGGSVGLNRPAAERCFSMRLANSDLTCNPNCCTSWRRATSAASAPARRCAASPGWSPRPTATWNMRSSRGVFGPICSTGST